MPVIDGEKWACSSCIKGHRVSGCTHNDRELHHINPKGRPVKQCEHCRGARKSKSHHAKCDCGDKKDKPKDKGDATGMLSTGTAVYDISDASLAHDDACQCHSGGKCLCGTKKDLDLRLDTGRQTLHDARAKPKLSATHSESHLTVFANGHHKPCHRNNNSAHVSGVPYKIPRPHTLHGHSAFAALTHGTTSYSKPEVPTTRSMDTLSLSNNDFYAMFGSNQRSGESLPLNPILDGLPFQENMFASQSETFGHESESPSSNVSESFATQQWPWVTNTVTPVTGTFAYGSLSTSPSQDCLPNLDNEWGVPSSGFNPLWSAGDLPLDPSKFSDSLTQPISHSGESKQSGPGLTVASSAHSEVGEPNLFGDLDFNQPQSAASESLFWEDSPVYRFTTSMPSESIEAPVSMPTPMSMANFPDVKPTFPKDVGAAPLAMTSTASSDFGETAAISMPSNFEDMPAIETWPLDQSNGAFGALPNFDLNYSNSNWF
ncbi:hypothetical protein T440DRAFT_324613 [Plenodomus tracheiphilus IPT5]|uniref:Copper-fist domain-containing protein n=1 Tax=Plenodomus tracheiphilus IPT5 TaxID=1408161 RepID=A0A6A7BF62_9PLEO|nr:hypothetical protein T440DRAFT_324613 [Plenodomus tracheiphilus IPT5]